MADLSVSTIRKQMGPDAEVNAGQLAPIHDSPRTSLLLESCGWPHYESAKIGPLYKLLNIEIHFIPANPFKLTLVITEGFQYFSNTQAS